MDLSTEISPQDNLRLGEEMIQQDVKLIITSDIRFSTRTHQTLEAVHGLIPETIARVHTKVLEHVLCNC